MRSSIACVRCRRSKVKCVNSGVNTTCRDCENKGRECTYPSPNSLIPLVGSARRESSVSRAAMESNAGSDRATPRRSKPKKVATPSNVSTKESIRAMVDALDPSVITPKIWIDLFEIFQNNFAMDLPFLHPPTFLKPLRQMTNNSSNVQDFGSSQQEQPPAVMPPAPPVLLLAFLALTAKYHPQLVAHHSPPSGSRPSNPYIASEYYAAASRARLAGSSGDGLGTLDVNRVQALLMLASHEWSHSEGSKAYISLGVACRYAQLMGLQYDDYYDDEADARSRISASTWIKDIDNDDDFGGSDTAEIASFIAQESLRRTFWACFSVDRMLSSGKYRPQLLRAEDLRLQLPSSDKAFLFGEPVRTPLLSQDEVEVEIRRMIHGQQSSRAFGDVNGVDSARHAQDEMRNVRWEVGHEEGVLSRYMKAINIYGKIVTWSCTGGRRELYAPWDQRSKWYELHRHLTMFVETLPRNLTLSHANTSAHIDSRTSNPYSLLHAVLLLCSMILYREHVPFLPLRFRQPQGPAGMTKYSTEDAPLNFWGTNARELFRSARMFVDLVKTCKEWKCQIQSPLVGYAVYSAALLGTYSNHFPWMDQECCLCKKPSHDNQRGHGDTRGSDSARHAVELLAEFRPTIKLADGWFKTLDRLHKFYKRAAREIPPGSRQSGDGSMLDGRGMGTRESGFDASSEEYKLFERALRDNAGIEEGDVEMQDAPDLESAPALSAASSVVAAPLPARNEREGRIHESSPDSIGVRRDRWAAINSNNHGGNAQQHQPDPAINEATNTNPSSSSHFHQLHSASAAVQQQQQYRTATPPLLHSPPPNFGSHAPYAHNPNQLPPIDQIQQGRSLPPVQKQLPQRLSRAWTPEPRGRDVSAADLPPTITSGSSVGDIWQQNLDLHFGGDDLAAFMEGRPPNSEATTAGWLSTIWSLGAGIGGGKT